MSPAHSSRACAEMDRIISRVRDYILTLPEQASYEVPVMSLFGPKL